MHFHYCDHFQICNVCILYTFYCSWRFHPPLTCFTHHSCSSLFKIINWFSFVSRDMPKNVCTYVWVSLPSGLSSRYDLLSRHARVRWVVAHGNAQVWLAMRRLLLHPDYSPTPHPPHRRYVWLKQQRGLRWNAGYPCFTWCFTPSLHQSRRGVYTGSLPYICRNPASSLLSWL